MKIALFYPGVSFAPWSMCRGLADALERVGHTVITGKLPAGEDQMTEASFEDLKSKLPNLGDLADTELVILSGPEFIAPWIDAIYGKYEWKFSVKGRKVAWYHSPFFNDKVTINFEHLSYYADEHFFPAIQDAEFFDQEGLATGRAHWLPFGVDTKVFDAGKIFETRIQRTTILAHAGLIGDKAMKYMGALSQHEHPAVVVGQVKVEDLSGFLDVETASLLSLNLRSVKVFFNFPGPPYLEAKLLEAMACGAMVITPMLSAKRGINTNHSMFQNGTHWLSYKSANVPHVAKLLREWSSDAKAEEREKIAATGLAEVRTNHSLEKRLEEMFVKLGIHETTTAS